MIVYKISIEQLKEWTGDYNGNGFYPIEDANGNFVVGLNCAENENYPFIEELKQCTQIEYVPILKS